MKLFSSKSSKTAKKRKRILLLYDFPIKGGGSGTYVKQLALRLSERNMEVGVAMPDKEVIGGNVKQFYIKLPQIPVFIGRPGLEDSKLYSDLSAPEITSIYMVYLEAVVRIAEEFKPDIIHAHHLLINSWAADYLRGLYGIKYIATSHGSDLFAITKDRRYFRKTREALRAADLITVVSSDTRIKLLKMFGKELAGKTRTVPGGIRIDHFPEKIDENELEVIRNRYKLKPENIVLFTGRLIDEKGVEYLLKAATRIKGQIIIAGDGPQRKRLEEMVKERKLENVHLTGYVDHDTLIKLYYVSDVYVSPTTWEEPFGLALIEAMAAKLPVIATRRGGVSSAIKDGQTGFFVRTRNATDIAEKVNMVLADDDLRKKIGEKARAEVLKKFTWKKIAERFDTIYSKI